MNQIRRILVPVDFSEPSLGALEYAAKLARDVGASVDVLHVWELPLFLPPDTIVAAPDQVTLGYAVREAAQVELSKLLARAEERGVEIGARRLEMGAPHEVIPSVAAKGGYDLIVMGTHGRTGLSRAFLGSVAARVLPHAPCPVLTVRPPSN